MSDSRARVVGGRIVRQQQHDGSTFSWKRFLFVIGLSSLLIVTNPSNDELYDKTMEIIDNGLLFLRNNKSFSSSSTTNTNTNNRRRKKTSSPYSWNKVLDPPSSITNYGIYTVEERHAKLSFSGLNRELWSCSYFDEHMGSFCSALARNLCHSKPLLHDPKDHAYTAHRVICYLLIATTLLNFCYEGGTYFNSDLALVHDPFFRAIFNSFGRTRFSLLSLGLDLFNASLHVYPTLVRMESIVPTLQEGNIASHIGLPIYVDFIFYVVVLVVFLGGGSNALASHFSGNKRQQPVVGFDSTVAAALGYGLAFQGAAPGSNPMFAPRTALWGYIPVNAVLGGSSLAWIMGGMLGTMLAQYHFDNQDLLLALKQTFLSAFK